MKNVIAGTLILMLSLFIGGLISLALISAQHNKEYQDCNTQAEISRKNSGLFVECLMPGLINKMDYLKYYGIGLFTTVVLFVGISTLINKRIYVK